MDKEQLKYHLVDNITSYLKYTLINIVEEHPQKVPIFNSVLEIMSHMNKYTYSYTLKDIDDTLFDSLISETISVLK